MRLAAKRITPIGNMVQLQVFKVRETPGGLTLPDTAPAGGYQTPQALVVAAGPECKQVKRGDRVVAPGSLEAWKLIMGTEEFIMVPENQLFGIVDPPRDGCPGMPLK